MRIGIISTLATPVRQGGGGSVEQLVWLLARELTLLGHEVTTFATAGSVTDGELVATLPDSYGRAGSPYEWYVSEWINLCRAIEQSDRFDVLHSHNYMYGLPLQSFSRAPIVNTLHIQPRQDTAALWSLYPNTHVTAISNFQWGSFPQHRPLAVIPHGIDSTQFSFVADPDDYVCFLGRFIPDKGPLQAISAARALGLRIRLAGPKNEYFNKKIAPIVDGQTVDYVGAVTGNKRNELLGNARALLYPIRSPEPFGLVMAEALMCGTPVAATRIGAVPEIIDEGVTGCISDSDDKFAQAVISTFSLDRRQVRERALSRYAGDRMAREYCNVYRRVVDASS